MRTRWTLMLFAALVLIIACSTEQTAEQTAAKAPAGETAPKAKIKSPAIGAHSDTAMAEEKAMEGEEMIEGTMEKAMEDVEDVTKEAKEEVKEVVKKKPAAPAGS